MVLPPNTVGLHSTCLITIKNAGAARIVTSCGVGFSHPTSAEALPGANPDSLTGLDRAVIECVKPQSTISSAK